MPASTPVTTCPQCGTQVAPALLSCPGCRQLLHADELKRLAAEAEAATRAGNLALALTSWRDALALLPPDSRQHQAISERIGVLSRQVDTVATKPAEKRPAWAKGSGLLGMIGLFLWKFKIVIFFVLTKAKFLLLGLTKAGTIFSMFLSFGLYWHKWGWKLAAGLVLSIYIHEMGHIVALRRFGIKASVPMFIPGLGALIRLRQHPADPREDARVGLAGPIWGLGAAVGALAVFLATGWGSWGAIARLGAWINLFNLTPVWQLDGARGFRALSRTHRWWVVGAFALMWGATGESLLVLPLLVAGFRAFGRDAAVESDRRTLVEFLFLIVALSLLCLVEVPIPE